MVGEDPLDVFIGYRWELPLFVFLRLGFRGEFSLERPESIRFLKHPIGLCRARLHGSWRN